LAQGEERRHSTGDLATYFDVPALHLPESITNPPKSSSLAALASRSGQQQNVPTPNQQPGGTARGWQAAQSRFKTFRG